MATSTPTPTPTPAASATLADPALLDDLVAANRILAQHGVLDAFGHVSVRHPEQPDHYIIARSQGPERVTVDDLQRFTLAGDQVAGSPLPAYSERAIHGAIYEARPDVMAICHNHAPSSVVLGVTGIPLRPMLHMAGLLGAHVPVWDPRHDFGDTDMLVRSLEQGRSLARTLGPRRVALMRGHGSVVAGQDLREVVLCSVYMEHNARLQREALALGQPITYLSDGEIERIERGWAGDPVIRARAWDTWRARVGL